MPAWPSSGMTPGATEPHLAASRSVRPSAQNASRHSSCHVAPGPSRAHLSALRRMWPRPVTGSGSYTSVQASRHTAPLALRPLFSAPSSRYAHASDASHHFSCHSVAPSALQPRTTVQRHRRPASRSSTPLSDHHRDPSASTPLAGAAAGAPAWRIAAAALASAALRSAGAASAVAAAALCSGGATADRRDSSASCHAGASTSLCSGGSVAAGSRSRTGAASRTALAAARFSCGFASALFGSGGGAQPQKSGPGVAPGADDAGAAAALPPPLVMPRPRPAPGLAADVSGPSTLSSVAGAAAAAGRGRTAAPRVPLGAA